ncbi:MAG: hypothetical protein JWQ38_2047 [Flavipsychrobacter sp.]|nr:hypothetical protein [Flavipsychrobacter sp.]
MKHTIKISAAVAILGLTGMQPLYAQSDALFVNKDGLVGMGTSEPAYNLTISNKDRRDINSNLAFGVDNSAIFAAKNSSGSYEYYMWPRGSDNKMYINFGSAGLNIRNNTSDTKLTILDNGNVGIGSTNPENKLQLGGNMHMMGNAIYFKNTATDKNAVVHLGDGDKMEMGGYKGVTLGYTDGQDGKVKQVLDIHTDNNVNIMGNVLTRLNHGVLRGKTRIGMSTGDFTGMEIEVRPHNTQIHRDGSGGIIKFYTWGYSTKVSDPSMTITEDGRVGIGTQTPKVALEVTKAVSYNTLGGFQYMKNGTTANHNGVQDRQGSIMASEDICTKSHFVAYSDSRIKKDLHHSSPADDLATLNKLKVTDYKYIDSFDHGTETVKGLIAQEVEAVYPEAVSTGGDFIPSVFANPVCTAQQGDVVSFTMAQPHHLANGNVVKLVTTDHGTKELPVTVTDANTFTVAGTAGEYTETFVFGKYVDDFRRVDYDRVFTLNVSATQQLSKEVAALKAEVAALKQKNNELENTIMARLQKLEVASKTAGR